jgi:FAD-linked oxidoreductase
MRLVRLTRRALLRAGALGALGALLPVRVRSERAGAGEPLRFEPGRPLPWHNWAGNQACRPQARVAPATEEELVGALARARGVVRPAGTGHSFSALVPSDGTLIFADLLSGVVSADPERQRAEVWAGTRLHALGLALAGVGQALPNLSDIDYQTLGGALATATHGTGATLGALGAAVRGLALATPRGELLECDAARHPELFAAARTSLGALGVLSRVTLQNRASYRLVERTEFTELEPVLAEIERHRRENRHFELMPFPHSSVTLLVATNETDAQPDLAGDEDPYAIETLETLFRMTRAIPWLGDALFDLALRLQPDGLRRGPSYAVLAHPRIVRFREMEYTVPAEVGPACLREVLHTIRERQLPVHWPLEYRYVQRDDAWLSMFHERDGCSISVHQSAELDHRPVFDAVEPIFWKYDGRPHWGKLHSLDAARLAPLYPRWRDFREVRRALDPEGRLLNAHLRTVLGEPGAGG